MELTQIVEKHTRIRNSFSLNRLVSSKRIDDCYLELYCFVQKQNKKRHTVVFDLLCCLLDIIAFQSHADRRQSINMSLKRKRSTVSLVSHDIALLR